MQAFVFKGSIKELKANIVLAELNAIAGSGRVDLVKRFLLKRRNEVATQDMMVILLDSVQAHDQAEQVSNGIITHEILELVARIVISHNMSANLADMKEGGILRSQMLLN